MLAQAANYEALSKLGSNFNLRRYSTADAFGFDDEASSLALSSSFPNFPGVGRSTAPTLALGRGDAGRAGGGGGGGKPRGAGGRGQGLTLVPMSAQLELFSSPA